VVFVDACEDLVMADDVITPSNPLVAPIEEEELEKTLLDMNISQWSRDEKPSQRVVCIRIDHSTWDCRLFPNPHTLTIYLEFVPARGIMPERFEKCQCEDDDVCFHCRTWVPSDGHYHWLQGLINPLSMDIESNT
jgi:hypothetical protein